MLKTEIRRLYEERKEVRKARLTDEHSGQVIERKYILAKETVEKLKAERKQLQRTCFELRTHAETMEKRFNEAKLQAVKIAERAGKSIGNITSRYVL